jgi:putative zinc finger protein
VPDHPDHEQLAAFQAGDVDRRQRADVEAHLAGCPSCVEVVASVERARGRLALLEEPELPPGLHDRLTAAVDAEAGSGLLASRPTPWYRRPVALAAAAALLLIALAAPLLDLTSRDNRTTADAGDAAGQEAAAPEGFAGGPGLPVIRVPGAVSAATVRATLRADPQARLALERARAGGGLSAGHTATTRSAPPAPAAGTQRQGDDAQAGGGTATPPGGAATLPGNLAAPPGGVADQRACLSAAAAAAAPAARPLVAAFYVEGVYEGRQATVLVTTSSGSPARTDLWVFPRGDCSGQPLATERVR